MKEVHVYVFFGLYVGFRNMSGVKTSYILSLATQYVSE